MKKQFLAGLIALATSLGATEAKAATYAVSADTSIYEFLGNLSNMGTTDVLVFNHESNHGTRALLDFNSLDSALSTLATGTYTATLNLYASCVKSGFVAGCPGDADAGSPNGIAAVTTDIFTQNGAWTETGAVTWSNISEGTKYGAFTVDNANAGWISINVTSLVEFWAAQGSTGDGIVLSQEAYGVVRNDANSLVVFQAGSKENGFGAYIEITEVQAVPVPAAAWLFGPALLGLAGVSRSRKAKASEQ
ncbi:MAG: hypothetical protein QM709_11440 [Spongiibacteraceae bacterium]